MVRLHVDRPPHRPASQHTHPLRACVCGWWGVVHALSVAPASFCTPPPSPPPRLGGGSSTPSPRPPPVCFPLPAPPPPVHLSGRTTGQAMLQWHGNAGQGTATVVWRVLKRKASSPGKSGGKPGRRVPRRTSPQSPPPATSLAGRLCIGSRIGDVEVAPPAPPVAGCGLPWCCARRGRRRRPFLFGGGSRGRYPSAASHWPPSWLCWETGLVPRAFLGSVDGFESADAPLFP